MIPPSATARCQGAAFVWVGHSCPTNAGAVTAHVETAASAVPGRARLAWVCRGPYTQHLLNLPGNVEADSEEKMRALTAGEIQKALGVRQTR